MASKAVDAVADLHKVIAADQGHNVSTRDTPLLGLCDAHERAICRSVELQNGVRDR
jgi:hypothetical protein